DSLRFFEAIKRIDAANAEDPNRGSVDGREAPAELLYGQRMTRWLDRLEPQASEPLRLAVRSQHLCRWMIPRNSYPMTRAGYLQWRAALGRFHAEKAGQILHDVGYDEPTISRVQSLVRKERLKADAEAQTLEDVACLDFLEEDFAELVSKHAGDEEKLLNILRRTWKKMSPRGHEAAMTLKLGERERKLVEKAALAPPAS